ncbi:MAG: ParB/RepB/Spo0J family partition protein [Sphingomonadales bacterium]|nr:ParB/RepB/Spo0J family partition protein [Sphingomonadales bacterium]MDE2568302.1 ParB/RepB/Spo0J family partition protein [Sphingomonadales bacterium]
MSEHTDQTAPAKPSPAKRTALGRGLGALMGETRREEPLVRISAGDPSAAPASKSGSIAMIPVAEIEPHPENPRRHFDEEALDELARSISARGLIQPIVVRPLGGGHYQLVAGERRWRAAQRARVHEIPAIVRRLDDREVTALALIENLQREDLNPVEEARAYQKLSERDGLTQQDIADFVDKSRSHVANLMRLLSLPAEVLDMLERDKLQMGHARAIATVPDPAVLARQIVAKGLSVREAERLAKRTLRGDAPARRNARAGRNAADSADIAAVQAHLEEFLGLRVRIDADADPRSGSVTIRYKTLDQLDLICQRLTGGDI